MFFLEIGLFKLSVFLIDSVLAGCIFLSILLGCPICWHITIHSIFRVIFWILYYLFLFLIFHFLFCLFVYFSTQDLAVWPGVLCTLQDLVVYGIIHRGNDVINQFGWKKGEVANLHKEDWPCINDCKNLWTLQSERSGWQSRRTWSSPPSTNRTKVHLRIFFSLKTGRRSLNNKSCKNGPT